LEWCHVTSFKKKEGGEKKKESQNSADGSKVMVNIKWGADICIQAGAQRKLSILCAMFGHTRNCDLHLATIV